MRFGALEIGMILVIVLIVFAVSRLRRMSVSPAPETETPVRVRTSEQPRTARRPRLQIVGFIVILVGILVLLSGLNMIRWVILSPIVAGIIFVLGLATIFMARR